MQASKKQIRSLTVLRRRDDFLRVQKAGRKWVAKSMVVEAAPNGGEDIRYGLTVSKKVSKSAVDRNRARRRLRAAARDLLPVYLQPGTDIVLIGRVETARRPYAQLKEDLRWCLKKLDLLKDPP